MCAYVSGRGAILRQPAIHSNSGFPTQPVAQPRAFATAGCDDVWQVHHLADPVCGHTGIAPVGRSHGVSSPEHADQNRMAPLAPLARLFALLWLTSRKPWPSLATSLVPICVACAGGIRIRVPPHRHAPCCTQAWASRYCASQPMRLLMPRLSDPQTALETRTTSAK